MSHLHNALQIERSQTINSSFHIAPSVSTSKWSTASFIIMGQDPSTPGKDCMLCNFAEYAGRVERTMLRASLPSPSLSEMSSSGCSSLSCFGGGSGSCKTHAVVSILIQIAIFPNQTKPGKKLMAICSPKPVGRQISLSHRRRQASVLPERPGWSPQSVLLS